MSLYIYYYSYSKARTNSIPLKAVVIITPGELDLGNNISIAGTSKPDL